MTWGAVASAAATVVVGAISADQQRKAAHHASDVQQQAAQSGIEEQRRQFDALQKLLEPYQKAGLPALQQQMDLLGLSGADAQQAAISAIQNQPGFQSMIQQGENAMMQNASATGGLRGGNLQGAMAQFRPQMLAQAIQDRYNMLGGMTSLGQQSAAGVGTAGMQTGRGISDLLGQMGAAQAGGILGSAKAQQQMYGSLMQGMGGIYGAATDKSNPFLGNLAMTTSGI